MLRTGHFSCKITPSTYHYFLLVWLFTIKHRDCSDYFLYGALRHFPSRLDESFRSRRTTPWTPTSTLDFFPLLNLGTTPLPPFSDSGAPPTHSYLVASTNILSLSPWTPGSPNKHPTGSEARSRRANLPPPRRQRVQGRPRLQQDHTRVLSAEAGEEGRRGRPGVGGSPVRLGRKRGRDHQRRGDCVRTRVSTRPAQDASSALGPTPTVCQGPPPVPAPRRPPALRTASSTPAPGPSPTPGT